MRYPAVVLQMLLLCLHVVHLRGKGIKYKTWSCHGAYLPGRKIKGNTASKRGYPRACVSVCVRTEGLHAANQYTRTTERKKSLQSRLVCARYEEGSLSVCLQAAFIQKTTAGMPQLYSRCCTASAPKILPLTLCLGSWRAPCEKCCLREQPVWCLRR